MKAKSGILLPFGEGGRNEGRKEEKKEITKAKGGEFKRLATRL